MTYVPGTFQVPGTYIPVKAGLVASPEQWLFYNFREWNPHWWIIRS